MCDVMPTISEDGVAQRAASQFATAAAAAAAAAASGNGEDEANFEQLMVSMLDERDKLGRNSEHSVLFLPEAKPTGLWAILSVI